MIEACHRHKKCSLDLNHAGKLASAAGKLFPATGGVVNLSDPKRQVRLLKIMPVGAVWGVGKKTARHLNHQGIHTALDLARCNRSWIRKRFSVVLERTVCELQGESCIPFSGELSGNKHQIVVSRSFGERVTNKEDLHAALASFISRACEKLREQSKFAAEAIVFIRTDPFREGLPQDSQSIRLPVPVATNDTRAFLKQLGTALDRIYRKGLEYKKAGVILCELSDSQNYQVDLWSDNCSPEASTMMRVIDEVNRKFGKNCLHAASINLGSQKWHMKQAALSPRYTTEWNNLLKVKC